MAQEQCELGLADVSQRKLSGVSRVKGDNYEIEASNRGEYLNHVQARAEFTAPPKDIFAILTNTDNTHLFRDVKGVDRHKVIKQEAGLKVVEFEQLAELKLLWITKKFRSCLERVEDQRDPSNLSVEFNLQSSDVLSKFKSKWTLRPKVDPSTGKVGTETLLEQHVLPRGVPPQFKHIPILGGALRGTGICSTKNIMEDVQAAVNKLSEGVPMEELLNPKSTRATSGPVASFAISGKDTGDQ